MLHDFSDLSFQNIDKAIAYHALQDHLHFRIIKGKQFYPNPKQLEFFASGLTAVERAFFAANKIGKSLCATLEVSAHLTLNYPDWWPGYVYDTPVNAWAAGVDIKSTNLSLKKYFFGDGNFPGLIHPSLVVSEEKRDNTYFILNKLGKISTLTFKSHDQGRESFQADSVNIVYLDEQYPFELHGECVARTAKISEDFHGMLIATFSPIKGASLTTMHYQQRTDFKTDETTMIPPGEVHNKTVYINATLDDALHIANDEKERMIASYAPHERDARVKGIPSMGSGLVYPIQEALITCSPFKIPDYWPRCFGLDFGWHHPTAAIFLAHDLDNDVIYAYAEYAASQLTPQHHAYELIKQGANWIPCSYDHAGEASNQADGGNVVELYYNAGIRVMVPADKRSVSKGIFTILQRMETGKFKIFTTLTKTLTEIRMYSRDENGKIKKGNDDLLDAMRYGVVTGVPIAKVHKNFATKWPANTMSDGMGWGRI